MTMNRRRGVFLLMLLVSLKEICSQQEDQIIEKHLPSIVTNDLSAHGVRRAISQRSIRVHQRLTRDMCGTILTSTTGSVTSPGYPSDYSNNVDCTVTIQAPSDKIIEITIDDLHIDYNNYTVPGDPDFPGGVRCYKDYVELEDVDVTSTRYCGQFMFRLWTSFSNEVKVHFHSDSSVVNSGFSSTYRFLDKPTDSLMFEFGSAVGDVQLPMSDDGSYPVTLGFPYKFYGETYNSLWINTNGVISFAGPMSAYDPASFPLTSGLNPLLAVYWADVDTRSGGQVHYRETSDPALLQQINHIISTHFNIDFVTSSAFVVTWYDVAFWATSWQGQAVRNTFQVALAADADGCGYAIFNFHEILWISSASQEQGAQIHTGLGNTGAKVGFDAGDGISSYSHEDSETINIKDIDTKTNIDFPGRFVFRVCDEEITECSSANGGCDDICNVDENGDVICSCQPGYIVDGPTCIYDDVCSENNGGCQQICINVASGQSRCDCTNGYVLDSDGVTCTIYSGTVLRICRKYIVMRQATMWTDASNVCNVRNMQFAEIQNDATNTAIQQYLGTLGCVDCSFWFGINRIDTLTWGYDSGNTLCYDNWASQDEANTDNDEKCGQFWSSTTEDWKSEDCNQLKGFLCQY